MEVSLRLKTIKCLNFNCQSTRSVNRRHPLIADNCPLQLIESCEFFVLFLTETWLPNKTHESEMFLPSILHKEGGNKDGQAYSGILITVPFDTFLNSIDLSMQSNNFSGFAQFSRKKSETGQNSDGQLFLHCYRSLQGFKVW